MPTFLCSNTVVISKKTIVLTNLQILRLELISLNQTSISSKAILLLPKTINFDSVIFRFTERESN
jgi:hypothetical protein